MELDDKSPQSSLDTNSSFVIIQKMSAENQKQIELTDNLLKNSSFGALLEKFDTESIIKNQPLAEGIENTIQELLKENAKLKETLQQNNLAMKQQFSTLAKWHEEVFNIHQTHKQKFEETKELVLKLRAENKDLKKQHQEIINSAQSKINNEIMELKQNNRFLQTKLTDMDYRKCYLSSEIQQKDRTIEHLKNRLSSVPQLSQENLSSDEKIALAQQKESKLEEHIAMQKHFAMNTRSEKEQELIQVVGDLSKQLENSERARRKLALEVDRLSAQEQKLQRILPSGESKNITDCCYWNAIFPTAVISAPFESQLIENMKRYDELFKQAENNVDEAGENKEVSSSSWINIARNQQEPSINSLKLEVTELRKLLAQEQTLNISKKELLDTAQTKFKELYKQCIAILKDHDTKMKAHEIESVKNREKLKELDVLKYELNEKENQIIQLEKEYAFMKKRLEEAELKNEDLFLLQSQIKVYEEDFQSEREARESLANEKDILEHNLNCLQQKNRELLRELKISQDDDGNSFKSIKDSGDDSVSRMALSVSLKPSKPIKILKMLQLYKFTCFNDTCSKSFLSEEELQEHIYSCLNLKD